MNLIKCLILIVATLIIASDYCYSAISPNNTDNSSFEHEPKADENVSNYSNLAIFLIKRNWSHPVYKSNSANLNAKVVLKVLRNGKIADIFFEKNSGDEVFDESILNAIKKSDPLPEFPEILDRPFILMGLAFTTP